MAFNIRKRCIRCNQKVREDGTCQDPNCVRFVPETTEENTTEPATTTAEDTSAEN